MTDSNEIFETCASIPDERLRFLSPIERAIVATAREIIRGGDAT